jgi:hypothetical protein
LSSSPWLAENWLSTTPRRKHEPILYGMAIEQLDPEKNKHLELGTQIAMTRVLFTREIFAQSDIHPGNLMDLEHLTYRRYVQDEQTRQSRIERRDVWSWSAWRCQECNELFHVATKKQLEHECKVGKVVV